MKVSHHKTVLGDSPVLEPETPLVFVLEFKDDDEGTKKKKRKKGDDVTMKNFGAKVSASRMKQSSKFVIGWRCRPGGWVQASMFSVFSLSKFVYFLKNIYDIKNISNI